MVKDRTLPPKTPLSSDPGTILLETERLILRRYLHSDAPAIAGAANFPPIAANLRDGFPVPYLLADAAAFLGRHVGSETYPEHAAVLVKPGIPENPSSEPLYIGGMGMIIKKDVEYRTWELGYWLTPSSWGKGFATEAVRGFVTWTFNMFPKLYRIEADPYATNTASIKVLEKCGFTKEGVLRRRAEKEGVLLDLHVYSMIRSDLDGHE